MSLYIGRNPLQQIGKNKDDIETLQQGLTNLQVPQLTSPNYVTYSTADGAAITYDNGTNLRLPIKPGSGINVDATADHQSLEIKVGDTVKIPTNSGFGIQIDDADNSQFVYFDGVESTINFPGDGITWFTVGGDSDTTNATNVLGPEITAYGGMALGSAGEVTTWIEVCPVYQFPSTIPTTASNGTLPNDASWIYLKTNGQRLKLYFNKEYYTLADDQHTTGTLVFSHVGYEGSQLIVKTITITISTRGWVLTTIKPVTDMAVQGQVVYSDTTKNTEVGYICFNIPCVYGADIDTIVLAISNTAYINCSGYVTVNGTTYPIIYADQYDPETGTIYLYTPHNTNGTAYYINSISPDYIQLN